MSTTTAKWPSAKAPKPFKCGKKPASPVKVTDLLYSKYRIAMRATPLPPHPATFGNTSLPGGRSWGMLGNDRYGCCVPAWAAHYIMLAASLVGKTVNFDEASVLKNYAAATGFDQSQDQPDGTNPTDQGTDMAAFMDWWRTVGMTDADGNVHKLDAYVRLDIGNPEELLEAMFIFLMPGLGIEFPDSAMTQTQQGLPWSVVPGPEPTEGHCFGGGGYNGSDIEGNTWNMGDQLVEPPFLEMFLDEGFVPVIKEMLDARGEDAAGFDLETLMADLNALFSFPPAPAPVPPPTLDPVPLPPLPPAPPEPPLPPLPPTPDPVPTPAPEPLWEQILDDFLNAITKYWGTHNAINQVRARVAEHCHTLPSAPRA